MLENLIYFSPMLVLLTAFFVLIFGDHEEEYNCFSFSRIMLILGLVLTIIFYNKATIPNWTTGSKFPLLFDILLYGFGLALLYPSRKWFASMNVPAYTFCGFLILTILSGSLLNCSVNLLLTGICCILIMLGNYAMLQISISKKEITWGGKIYLFAMLICVVLLVGCSFIIYRQCGSLMYSDMRAYLEAHQNDLSAFALMTGIILPFMFLLALAPLHFWFTEISSKTVLPVFSYFVLIPIIAVTAGFIQLNVLVLQPLLPYLRLFYIACALISVGIGAVGSCSSQNIYKIFAFGSVYHLGIIFLTMRKFTLNSVNSGFVYFFTYLLAMYGICTCLFGLKKKGEHLTMLNEFEGAAYKRPYISAMMTIFMFSMLGMPPFLGFLGTFSVLNYLALHHHFYQLIYLLGTMLIIGYSYIQIIRALYFEERKSAFDRADSGIYTVILLLALLMAAVMLRPYYLITDFRSMLEAVFL